MDFEKEGITVFRDGDFICADGTTLGADNGIGVAASLALILDKNINHPKLELLFTIDEETGLHGAINLDPTLVSGKRLLNLDSEVWGQLIIGCAGGVGCEYEHTYTPEVIGPEKLGCFKLMLSGLTGGHSGIDINKERGNAHKILAEILFTLNKKYDLGIRLYSWKGGRAHNIIPREVTAVIHCEKNITKKDLLKYLKDELLRFNSYLPREEKNLNVDVEVLNVSGEILSTSETIHFLGVISLIPHGAHSYIHIEGTTEPLVNLSSNMAQVYLEKGKLLIINSMRFMDKNQVVFLKNQFEHLGRILELKTLIIDKYPSWRPDLTSPLLAKVEAIYSKVFKDKAQVTSIHAGLECGIIGDKLPGVEMISFGPTILSAHSPTERVQISTVETFWTLLVNVLNEI
ncbi:MAG: beta-Ala-His dipeptidase [Bacteriovoracaceae bacterium]